MVVAESDNALLIGLSKDDLDTLRAVAGDRGHFHVEANVVLYADETDETLVRLFQGFSGVSIRGRVPLRVPGTDA